MKIIITEIMINLTSKTGTQNGRSHEGVWVKINEKKERKLKNLKDENQNKYKKIGMLRSEEVWESRPNET